MANYKPLNKEEKAEHKALFKRERELEKELGIVQRKLKPLSFRAVIDDVRKFNKPVSNALREMRMAFFKKKNSSKKK